MNERLGIVEERQAARALLARLKPRRPYVEPKVHYIDVDLAKPAERTVSKISPRPPVATAPIEVEPIAPPVEPVTQDITIDIVQAAFLDALWDAGYRLKTRRYTREDLACKARSRIYSWPRHVCIHLVRNIVPGPIKGCMSYPTIGRAFGRMDHTSVMHAMWQTPSHLIEWPVLADVHAKVLAAFKVPQ
jgi:hypothetical protein